MKVGTYLRIAQSARGFRVAASHREPVEPLKTGSGSWAEPLPTIVVRLVLDIPNDAWEPFAAFVEVPASAVRQIDVEVDEHAG